MGTEVDKAFERCRLLAELVKLEYERARANPTQDRYVKLGVIREGDTRGEAVKKIEDAFSDLTSLVDHLTILDMAAALEKSFSQRITTAIGEARKTLNQKFHASTLAARENLIRDSASFEGLREIVALISAGLSGEIQEMLSKVRENRNRFAHGTDLRNPPTVLKDDARNALNEAFALLRPM